MQTFFYLEEVSRHCQSYLQRSATRKMTDMYLYTTIAHERKRIEKIPTKDIDLLYHLMPSNTLALGLYERCILKRTFRHTTGFCRFREEERRRLSRADNFLQQLRRSGVSRVRGEKVAAARTEKLCTHSHTHSLTHRTTAIPSLLACGSEGNDNRVLLECGSVRIRAERSASVMRI